MLINRVAQKLLAAPELAPVLHELDAGHDATLGVPQSARSLLVAALWARDPRPCLLVVSGEEAADRTARALAAWLGMDVVCRYPDRRDLPWADKPADDAVVGARCRAVARLAAGEKCLVVASARALLRRVPPVGSGYFASSTFGVGDEVDFADVPRLLVGMGYTDAGDPSDVTAAGTFCVHGDAVDVFPAQATSPVRLEFFGDEVDRVRRMVPATGQTIGELQDVTDRAAKSYYTRRDVKTLFSHFYKLAIRDDYVTDNKAQYIKLPKLIEKEKEIFTKDEIQTLWIDYNAHKCKVTAAILIMIYTGMRPGELLQIKTENVNLNEQYLTGGIKTEKGKRRKIIIPDRIVPLIQYLERASKDGLLCWYKNKNDFYDEWQEKRDELEIRECMTPYCCRHTYITQLTALGVSPAMLQELAGHEDYETTLNYTHLSVKDRLQEVNRL